MAVVESIPALTDESLETARRLFKAGKLQQAEAICRQLLRTRPNDCDALNLLGRVTYTAGNRVIGTAFVRRAIAIDPTNPAFYNTLGRILIAEGKIDEALATLRHAIEIDPIFVKAQVSLGIALFERGDGDAAVEALQKAIEIDPRSISAHLHLGIVLLGRFQPTDAEASFQRALAIEPDNAQALVCLGGAFLNQGRIDEAIAWFRRGLAEEPENSENGSNFLFVLHYPPDCGRETLFAEATAWNRQHIEPLVRDVRPHANLPDPGRRLRIGYVSADLHRHPVGYFLEGVLRAHDKSQVEVFCYSNHFGADALSERLHAAADHWKMIVGIGDQAVAEAIRQDGIDILVDLSGHTGGHRLGLFGYRPAPVQVSWIGYFDTTGLSAIDYILLDRFVCPEGDERFYTETVVRLPDSYLCYTPQSTVDVPPLPALTAGHVTFGCFNKVAKVNATVIALWSEVLRALPTARLCLKDTAFNDPTVRDRYTRQFADHGIAAERFTLLGRTPYAEHLAAYGQVDVALDPFPFNGGTTTAEALWMGVPVVTLAGDHFVSRMGVSYLTTVGLPELIAHSPSDYVAKAVALARDVPRLAALRASLRQKMAQSPLCDGPRFTRVLEAAYRDMWKTWCQSRMAKGRATCTAYPHSEVAPQGVSDLNEILTASQRIDT